VRIVLGVCPQTPHYARAPAGHVESPYRAAGSQRPRFAAADGERGALAGHWVAVAVAAAATSAARQCPAIAPRLSCQATTRRRGRARLYKRVSRCPGTSAVRVRPLSCLRRKWSARCWRSRLSRSRVIAGQSGWQSRHSRAATPAGSQGIHPIFILLGGVAPGAPGQAG